MNTFDLRLKTIDKIHKYIKRLDKPIIINSWGLSFYHIFFYEGNNNWYTTELICSQLFDFIGEAQ